MSPYIVDASVAAKWFLPEEFASSARRVLAGTNEMHAPELFRLEMDSILCRHIRRGQLSVTEGDQIRAALATFPIQHAPNEMLRDAAYGMANQMRCSPYDCLYLALAVAQRGQMVTADRRFHDQVSQGPLATNILWIENVA